MCVNEPSSNNLFSSRSKAKNILFNKKVVKIEAKAA